MRRRPSRGLTPQFQDDLQTGALRPILKLVRDDRDLLLEIRSGHVDIYFKGHGLMKVDALSRGGYAISTHEKFARDLERRITSEDDAEMLLKRVPDIKHAIAMNSPHASEIEVEHFLMRMNNREHKLNSEYFAVDRQGIYGEGCRFDMLGVYWPRAGRNTEKELSLCVMEVKFAMGADIKNLAAQLKRYYEVVSSELPEIAEDTQKLLRQKIELGLFGNDDRLKKLKGLKVSRRLADVRCVVILAEQNPYSGSFDPETLVATPFFETVEIFRVGFGLWSTDAFRREDGRWARPASFGRSLGGSGDGLD